MVALPRLSHSTQRNRSDTAIHVSSGLRILINAGHEKLTPRLHRSQTTSTLGVPR